MLFRSGAEMIKAHPWFRGVDFETIHQKTPPFVPQLSTPGDTRYFEDEIDDVRASLVALWIVSLIRSGAEPSSGSRCWTWRSCSRRNEGPHAPR